MESARDVGRIKQWHTREWARRWSMSGLEMEKVEGLLGCGGRAGGRQVLCFSRRSVRRCVDGEERRGRGAVARDLG